MAKTNIVEVTVSLPFTINESGSVTTTTVQQKIWADRARTAISTRLLERVMRPSFGTNIPKMLFDNEQTFSELIESEVQSAFETRLSLLQLNNVEVIMDRVSNTANVEVLYTLPTNMQDTISVGVAFIGPNAAIIEEF